MTFAVDWALKNNYLFYLSLSVELQQLFNRAYFNTYFLLSAKNNNALAEPPTMCNTYRITTPFRAWYYLSSCPVHVLVVSSNDCVLTRAAHLMLESTEHYELLRSIPGERRNTGEDQSHTLVHMNGPIEQSGQSEPEPSFTAKCIEVSGK